VGVFRARSLATKVSAETIAADRLTEIRQQTFQVRRLPFLSLYQPGDRLEVDYHSALLSTEWLITGWKEVPGMRGMFVEIHAQST
jgi:hypothetical protein